MTIVTKNSLTVSNVNDGTITHYAYANSADGTDGFYVGGGTNLLFNSNFSSGLARWTVNPGGNKDCKAVVTTDSDGDTCIHITGTGVACGIYSAPAPFNQNQIATGSVFAKGTGRIMLVGLEGRPASNFGTVSTESYSKVGSTTQASSKKNNFSVYFSAVNGVVDVYIKFVKLEQGDKDTPWSPAPSEAHPSYIGQYTDFNTISSTDPAKYAPWIIFKGNDGKTSYTHVAYANSSDGMDGFTTVYPNLNLLNFNSGVTLGKHYGWRLDATSWSGNRAIFNKVKVTPNKQYTINANWSNTAWLNVYAFTNESDTTAVARYGSASGGGVGSWDSSNLAGGYTVSNNMTFTVPTNVNYIGVSYASLSTDTLTLQALLNGEPKLEQGSTATPWMPSASEVKTSDYPSYIGQYRDFTQADSTSPSDYTWSLIRGEDGKTYYTHTAYAYSADGTDRLMTAYPNLNLLDGTKDFSGTWTFTNNWVTDGIYKGLTVRKRTAQFNGICKTFTVPKDGTYTFSAYIKSSGDTANIKMYAGVNNTQPTTSKLIGNNFDWTRDSITLDLKANDTVWISYNITGAGADSILWNAGHKWEKGSTATPYMPSASEVKTSDYPSYIGTYSDTNVDGSTDPSKYTWTVFKGADGIAGANAPTITNVQDQIYLSTSNTAQSGGSWGILIPAWSSGKYYWSRVATTFDNGTTTYSTPVLDEALNQATTNQVKVSQLTQDLDGFKTTVSNTYLSKSDASGTYADKVSVASQINQSATAVTSNVQTWTNNKLTAYSTTQQTATSITNAVASKADKSQITQLSNQITSVVTDVSAIKVGGQNLLLGTATANTSTITQTGSYTITDPYNFSVSKLSDFNFKVDDYITLSFDWETTSTTGIVKPEINSTPYGIGTIISAKGTDGVTSNTKAITASEQRGHIEIVFKVSSTVKVSEASKLRLRFDNHQLNSTFTIKNAKLEKGNKATDWCIAPQEVASQSQITQLSDNINLRVSKGDVTSQINVEAGQILFNSNKLVLNANTTEINGNAFIRGDMIVDGSINAKKIVTNSLSAISSSLGDVKAGTYTSWSSETVNGILYLNGIYLYNGRIRSLNIQAPSSIDPDIKNQISGKNCRGTEVYSGDTHLFDSVIPQLSTASPNDILKGDEFWDKTSTSTYCGKISGYRTNGVPHTKYSSQHHIFDGTLQAKSMNGNVGGIVLSQGSFPVNVTPNNALKIVWGDEFSSLKLYGQVVGRRQFTLEINMDYVQELPNPDIGYRPYTASAIIGSLGEGVNNREWMVVAGINAPRNDLLFRTYYRDGNGSWNENSSSSSYIYLIRPMIY